MSAPAKYVTGQRFEARYPFVRCTYTAGDGEGGGVEREGWKPGVRYEAVGPEGTETHADGIGKVFLTVVGVYQPPGFPTRVFYLRTWENPEGVAFDKRKLRIVSQSAFTGYVHQGYRHWSQVDAVAGKKIDWWSLSGTTPATREG